MNETIKLAGLRRTCEPTVQQVESIWSSSYTEASQESRIAQLVSQLAELHPYLAAVRLHSLVSHYRSMRLQDLLHVWMAAQLAVAAADLSARTV